MTDTDDRIRELLRELAEEAQPAPFLVRLDRSAIPQRRWRRFVAAVAAVAVAAAALAVVVVSGRFQHTAEPLPTDRPPKVFRLTDMTSARPGLACPPSRLAYGASSSLRTARG
jgi:anti-sigma-K factor RskA